VRRAVLTLVLIACFSFFLGLGQPAISDSDEGFYAEAAREMVEGGDWLTPHFNYEERWQKPVLYYWLTSATYLVSGPNEWGARFWSAVSGLGLVLVTWAAARRMFAQDDISWLAGAIVATCFGYFAMARFALPDLPLTFFITLTVWAGFERKWIVVGLAAGLGFLMKGPVALVVPFLVLTPIWWHERHTLPIRVRDLTLAAVVGAVVGLPWYAAMTIEHGVPYLQSFFVGDNLERFATDRFNEPRGLWFYLPIVVGGMFPWSIYLGKQPRYILPVLPPLAILLARSIAERIRKSERGEASGLAGATWGTAAMFLVVALLLYRARPLFVAAYPSLTTAGIVLTAGGALVLAWLAATRKWRLLPPVATTCAVAFLLTLQFGAIAGIRPEPVEQMATLIGANRSSEPVGTYQVFVRNLAFYTGSAQRDLFNEELALDFLRSPQPVLLVVRSADLPRLEAISGVTTRRLGQVRYLNTANIRLRALLSPIPEQDVETVLLVSNR